MESDGIKLVPFAAEQQQSGQGYSRVMSLATGTSVQHEIMAVLMGIKMLFHRRRDSNTSY